jgi:hypothetical protein
MQSVAPILFRSSEADSESGLAHWDDESTCAQYKVHAASYWRAITNSVLTTAKIRAMSTMQNLSSNGTVEHFVTADGTVRHAELIIDLADRLIVEFILYPSFLFLPTEKLT